MKKFLIIAMAAAFALALAGCAGQAEQGGGDSGATAPEPAAPAEPSAEPSDEPMAGMANPWSEVATAAEAAQGAGVADFSVQDEVTVGDVTFRSPAFS